MAKKTRAQRKKITAGASKQQFAPKDELVNAEAVDESSSVVEQEVATKVSEPKKAQQQFEAPLRDAKEEKAYQKRVERAKKATAKAEKKKEKGKSNEDRKPRFFWRIVDFFVGVKHEMKRVTWPTGNEVVKMSVVVVCALVFFGVLIFVVDSIANPLFYWFSGLGA